MRTLSQRVEADARVTSARPLAMRTAVAFWALSSLAGWSLILGAIRG